MSSNIRRTFSGKSAGVDMKGRYVIALGYSSGSRGELVIRDIETGSYYRSYTDFGIDYDSQTSTGSGVGYLATRDYVNNIIYVASGAYYDRGTVIFQNETMKYYDEVYKLCTPDGRVVEATDNGKVIIDGNTMTLPETDWVDGYYESFSVFQCVGDELCIGTYVINLNDYSLTAVNERITNEQYDVLPVSRVFFL